ncbi:MAG: hypothetical protein HW416_851 [Chloroflexi bacterium]|nr:hypothetical protein [Chloroflexota bacterium]
MKRPLVGSRCDRPATVAVIRQIRRLTRAVPLAGPGAEAIAVYAAPISAEESQPDHLQAAREDGYEGVACVDDAARGVVLYCGLWRRRRDPSTREAARRLLRFLAYMQDEDGRFANFILDWSGQKNLTGRTSRPGGSQWQARALHALACGATTFGDDEFEERFQRGARWVDDFIPYLDVRSVCVLAAMEHWRATRSSSSADRALTWAEEISGQTNGDRLLNAAGDETIHLWGHLQETALAQTGLALSRPDFVESARASAVALLLPAVKERLPYGSALPFDVSCIASGLTAVASAVGDGRFFDAASEARAWFLGRNAGGAPVYDEVRGLVYDGIDDGRISRNSGAEANIEGALALLV